MKRDYVVIHAILFACFFFSNIKAQNDFQLNYPSVSRMEKIESEQASKMGMILLKEFDYEIIGRTEGISSGLKIIPFIPFFPRLSSLIHKEAKELDAEKNALEKLGGDLLINKRVERTKTGFLFIIWKEEIKVTGFAVKIKK